MPIKLRILTLLGVALIFAACGDDPPPRPESVAAAPASAAAKTTPTVAEAEAAVEAEGSPAEATEDEDDAQYVYNPIGKRDPFRSPFVDIEVVTSAGPKMSHPVGPLQRWAVEQLALRATITGTGSPMAMLVDPEGVGHVVRRGALVGKNWGKVTAIRRDCIVITEQLRDASGAVTAVKSQRCLPKTQREQSMEKQLAKGT